MYEYEEVKNDEVLNYGKLIGAFYHETSAKNSVGIDVMKLFTLYYIILYYFILYYLIYFIIYHIIYI
jgi:hypothetical protein